jgi:hypothetical protein
MCQVTTRRWQLHAKTNECRENEGKWLFSCILGYKKRVGKELVARMIGVG